MVSATTSRCRRRNIAWTLTRRCKTLRSPAAGRTCSPQILANLVTTSTTARPAVISHYNVQPMINVYAAVDGRDLGGVADEVAKRVKEVEKAIAPGKSHRHSRAGADHEDFIRGTGFGLLGAIVLAYLLIVVNFQSWLDPFIIITALARRAGGNLLDAADHPHHAERAVLDRARSCAWAWPPPTVF